MQLVLQMKTQKVDHRLQYTLTLSKLALGSAADENFVEIATVKNGVIQEVARNTDYSVLGETFARRTFDESGNYTVKDFGIDLRENLDDGLNEGVYSSGATTDDGNTSSENLLNIQISLVKHMFVDMKLKLLHLNLLMLKNQELQKSLIVQ